jgi:hypothetical protein
VRNQEFKRGRNPRQPLPTWCSDPECIARIEHLKQHTSGTYEAELEAELSQGNDPIPEEEAT